MLSFVVSRAKQISGNVIILYELKGTSPGIGDRESEPERVREEESANRTHRTTCSQATQRDRVGERGRESCLRLRLGLEILSQSTRHHKKCHCQLRRRRCGRFFPSIFPPIVAAAVVVVVSARLLYQRLFYSCLVCIVLAQQI